MNYRVKDPGADPRNYYVSHCCCFSINKKKQIKLLDPDVTVKNTIPYTDLRVDLDENSIENNKRVFHYDAKLYSMSIFNYIEMY